VETDWVLIAVAFAIGVLFAVGEAFIIDTGIWQQPVGIGMVTLAVMLLVIVAVKGVY
jgi:uncharacterized membrane protein